MWYIYPDCSSYSLILNNRFICSNHTTKEKEPNIQYIIRCTSVIDQMIDIPYKIFKKIEKEIEEEGRRRGLPVDEE